MAVTRTTLLAQGNTAATTAVVSIDAGQTVGLGIFAASGRIPAGYVCQFKVKTSGADAYYDDIDDGVKFGLRRGNVVRHFTGPIEVYVERPAGFDVGVEKIA